MAFTYFLILWSTAWSPSRLCESEERKQTQLVSPAKCGHRSPSPAGPWKGGCSAMQMCGAAAKLPGLGEELEASRGRRSHGVPPVPCQA